MGKTLSERIAARVAKKKPNQKAKNRAAFLANKEEIEAALNDGWSVKMIWETLHEEKKVSFSYQAFTKYVNNLIKKKSPLSIEAAVETPEKNIKTEQPKKQITSTSSKPKAFKFNPDPKKEDLL